MPAGAGSGATPTRTVTGSSTMTTCRVSPGIPGDDAWTGPLPWMDIIARVWVRLAGITRGPAGTRMVGGASREMGVSPGEGAGLPRWSVR